MYLYFFGYSQGIILLLGRGVGEIYQRSELLFLEGHWFSFFFFFFLLYKSLPVGHLLFLFLSFLFSFFSFLVLWVLDNVPYWIA